MKEKEKNTIIGQLLILDLFSLICGYYILETIHVFTKHGEWWYDLLVILIVVCEMTYNWIQLFNYKEKIPKLMYILTGLTISAIFSGLFFYIAKFNVMNGQGYMKNALFTAGWGIILVIANVMLWISYKKKNS